MSQIRPGQQRPSEVREASAVWGHSELSVERAAKMLVENVHCKSKRKVSPLIGEAEGRRIKWVEDVASTERLGRSQNSLLRQLDWRQTMESKGTTLATEQRLAGSSDAPNATTKRGAHCRRRYANAGLLLFSVICILPASSICQAPTPTTTATPTTTSAPSTPRPQSAGTQASSTIANDNETQSEPSLAAAPESIGVAPLSASLQQQVSKLKPVNFTLVDELFAASLDDAELVMRWKHMDAQFQDGIRGILKLIFPQIVAISQDAKVSGDCSGGILKWILSLRNLRSWAIKMLDATGKPTSGIFQGSLTMMGNYGQCLSVRAPDEDEIEVTDQFEEYFRGQFCVIHLRPHLPKKRPFYHLNTTIDALLRKQYKYYEKTLYDELAEIAIAFQFVDIRLDLCVPSTCTKADIQRVAELLSKKLEFRAKVLRCDIEARDSSGSISSLVMNDELVQYWILLPVFLLVVGFLATVLVMVKRLDGNSVGFNLLLYSVSTFGALDYLLSAPKSTWDEQIGKQCDQQTSGCKKAYFAKPLPLYGLRNVFVIWFIIVQMTVQLKYQYLRESLILRDMLLNYWPFQIIINTSMIFESFILITAFTYGYCNLESTIKESFIYILRKYLRMVPPIVTLIAVTILTPSLGIVSPIWKNFVDEQAATCKSTGYLNLFFLQNFISYDNICIPHSWLLCVELQLIAISIPLVALLTRFFRHTEDSVIIAHSEKDLRKNKDKTCLLRDTLVDLLKSQAGTLGILCVLFGTGINFLIVYTNRLPPTWFNTFPDASDKSYYFGTYLAKTWTHLSPFVIGLLAGHICRTSIQLRCYSLNMSRREESTSDCDERVREQQTESELSTMPANLTTSTSTSSIANESPSSSRGLVISVPQVQSASCCRGRKCGTRARLLQLSALVCMTAIVFSTYSWSTQQLPSPIVSALFDSLTRLIWSLALVGLMIQLCLPQPQTNDLTRFAQLLSCKGSIILGRLSLLVYLWAPYVHSFILAAQEQSLFPSLFLIFHVIVGNIVITYAVAFIMSLTIERPIRLALDKCILN